MGDILEQAALSGDLFRGRSYSPTRSEDTASVTNTDDELGSDISRPGSPVSGLPPTNTDDIGVGGPQTGPKGVINDRQSSDARNSSIRRAVIAETRAARERVAIVAPTIEEEDELRRRREAPHDMVEDDRARWRARRLEELRAGDVARGGLREVGFDGFLSTVERPGWVVILIYEPDIARCQELLAYMLQLALALPGARLQEPVNLVRARATSLAFSLLPAPTTGDTDEDDEEREANRKADPDVLPTVLAYRDGELERTWVRIDFELRSDGLEGLLRREGILRETKASVDTVQEDDE